MTSERLKRVTSKIESAVERLAQIDAREPAPSGSSLFDAPDEEQRRRAIEDRDRKIAKLRADLQDISDLKDQEIERLRDALSEQSEAASGGVDPDKHAALQRRYDRLKRAAEQSRARLDALIDKMEAQDG